MTNYAARPAAGFAPRFTPRTPLQLRLSATLWSWRAQSWSGFIDFREPGTYFTHWGFGRFDVDADDRRARLQNGFDPFFFLLEFDDQLTSFRCVDSNHADRPVGDALFDYGNQAPLRPLFFTPD